MKSAPFALPLIAALSLSACVTSPGQDTAIGALGGAAVGAAVSSDDDKLQGALTGAAVGAVAGTLIGRTSNPNQCRYRDGYGREYIAAC